jgi:ribosomal protein S21
MIMPNNIDNIEFIHEHLSYAEGKTDIINTISKLPLLSFIFCFKKNNPDEQYNGILVGVKKTYFKLITDLNDFDSVIHISFSDIDKIFYVTNVRTYHRFYQNSHKDKKKESDRKYYLKKKLLKQQQQKKELNLKCDDNNDNTCT